MMEVLILNMYLKDKKISAFEKEEKIHKNQLNIIKSFAKILFIFP